ncbi:hypothetical protein ACQKIK_01145 [Pseudomonas sp. NPDC047961]
MSQPEWDDQDLDFNNFPDENNFFVSHKPVELTRPEWFERVDIQYYQSSRLKLLARISPQFIKEWLRPFYYKIFYSRKQLSEVKMEVVGRASGISAPNNYQDDALKFSPHVAWLKKLVSPEDEVLFSYVLSPIYAMFCHDRPVVAVEIGTMRDIPFEDTSNGRMLAAAYAAADHVIITNPDVKAQADVLGLASYTFCPHPVDEDRYAPSEGREYYESMRSSIPDTDWLGVAPARQNWKIKGNYKYIDALRLLRAEGKKVSLIIPAWGQDIQESKSYAAKLGVNEYIRWIPPVAESTLIKMFSSFDFVLDQFELGVFGLITPKALACGGVVITSYDEHVHDWCFGEHPPLLSANSADTIAERIISVISGLGGSARRTASRNWFMTYHSKRVVTERLIEAANLAKINFKAKSDLLKNSSLSHY